MGKVSDLDYVYSYFHAFPQPFEDFLKFSNKDPWLIARQNLGHLHIILAFVFYFFTVTLVYKNTMKDILIRHSSIIEPIGDKYQRKKQKYLIKLLFVNQCV